MTITTTTDQAECLNVLDMLAMRETFKPKNPNAISDSMMQLDPHTFLVGTNNRGQYTLHLLTECNQAEALEFLKSLPASTGHRHINMRLEFVGAGDGSEN